MLCDHDYEREIVHPESRVEELIGIHEKDDIFDGFFDDTWVGFFGCLRIRSWGSINKKEASPRRRRRRANPAS